MLLPGREGATPPLFASLLAALALSLGFHSDPAYAGGSGPTTCANLCPNQQNPCVVSADVIVGTGSVIDCSSFDVQISGGNLYVHDGTFVLKANTLLVTSNAGGGHTITADCPNATGQQGFEVDTTGTITVGNASSLLASCSAGGGWITLRAGGAISIGGTGIHANGTDQGGGGGGISITTTGAVQTTAPLEAQATATTGTNVATGGGVWINASSISLGGPVTVSGYQAPGGQGIKLVASGDITTTAANTLDASTQAGDGGHVSMISGGTITGAALVKVSGFGTPSTGGTAHLEAQNIVLTKDITATGGTNGGLIELVSRYRISVGTGATSAVELNADANSNSPIQGGEVVIRSNGHDVTIDQPASVHANGNPGGGGGALEIEGAAVNAVTGSLISADGATGQGGTIEVNARAALTLSGTLHANNGTALLAYLCTTPGACEVTPTIGPGVTGNWTAIPEDELQTVCGDGIWRDSSEQCDRMDLAAQTCSSLGHGTGTLACNSDCTWDFSGCSL